MFHVEPVETPKRMRLKAYGTVQGVGFRAFTRHVARKLLLHGYVRNCADGAVEVEASGAEAALARLRAAIAKGPPYATVLRVEELPATDIDLGDGFVVRR